MIVCDKTKKEIKQYEEFNEDDFNLKNPNHRLRLDVICEKD